MDSSEVLKNAINKVGAKSIAADMNLSTSLIYKWCQPNDKPDDSGADNPLDRLLKIYECTKDPKIITWMCEHADGFFTQNPKPLAEIGTEIFESTQHILKEFSDLLEVVSRSYANDKQIDPEEAEQIRQAWESLKSVGETFVYSCEAGYFANKEEEK